MSLYWRLWRVLMRTAHRFNWCYLRPLPQIESDYKRARCDWCGSYRRDYVGPGLTGCRTDSSDAKP